MFEISIFCVILLAISYWAVLWTMGRREDVLHGEFVEAGAAAEEPVRSVFADKSALADRPSLPKPNLPKPMVRPVFPEPPAQAAVSEQAALPMQIAPPEKPPLPEKPVRAAVPEQQAFRPERLESLLNSIKQDLNQLVQK
jgi:hypothetical protein